MTLVTLEMTLSGPDPPAILSALMERGLAPTGKPRAVEVDDEKTDASGDWLGRGLARAKRTVYASFPGYPHRITVYQGALVYIGLPEVEVEPRAFAERLAGVPFELAAFASLYGEWQDGSLGDPYNAPSFSDWHTPLGWGCAFRRAGHDRLVSRRWLDFGPWRKLTASNDTTLIQFHDLDVGAEIALDQARPGHDRMGISETGGFIQSGFVFTHSLDGLYFPDQRKMKVVVHGRAITPLELLEWSAARKYQSFGPEKPVDQVAFIFMQEHEAQAHLHEIWLHGLECWTIRSGQEIRLDDGYAPKPSPPGWARNLP